MKILLAEDDKNLGRLLQNLLKKENIKTDWVEDGEAAYEQCYRDGYDVLILDWMMPKLDGIALCKRLRAEEYQGKILLLTARDSVEDKVVGLNEGADDYLVKPFAFSELLARVRTLLRRRPQAEPDVLRVADLELDLARHKAWRGGVRVTLTAKEMALLALFMRRRGEVLSRTLIAEQVWDMHFDSDTNVVDVAVRRLRAKIDEPFELKLIHTLRGVGYVLEVQHVQGHPVWQR